MGIPVAAKAVLVAAVAGMTIGCTWKGNFGGSPSDTEGQPPRVAWTLQPVDMRVYPSSRFSVQNQQAMLEARIELLDEMGDSTKGVGQFHFELFAGGTPGFAEAAGSPGHPGRPTSAQRLYTWDVPLLTLDDQKRHYDPITRAYLFRLRMDEQALPQRNTTLQASYEALSGERLKASTVLEAFSP
jgi:hypothetical protein